MLSGRILYVCTANICRSPMAELWTRHLLGPASPVCVHSAGVRGLEGQAMHPYSVRALEGRGVDPRGFRARQLRPEWVEEADLTLTASRRHRDLLLEYVPEAYDRLFTLREFAWLIDDSAAREVPDVRSLARVANNQRRLTAARRPTDFDLADPIGMDFPMFRACLDGIDEAVSVLARALSTAARR